MSEDLHTFFHDARVAQSLRRIEASKKFSSTGGKHRARALPPDRRVEISRKAAKARWQRYA